MTKLDRFAVGRKDPQEKRPVTLCDGCGGEIYPEDDVYYLDDGSIIHANDECLVLYATFFLDATRVQKAKDVIHSAS